MIATHITDSLQSILLGDVAYSVDPYPQHDRERRAALRAVFAAIEGLLCLLESELLSKAAGELTQDERSMLFQGARAARQNGAGKVSAQQCLKERLKSTANLLARLRPQFGINFQDCGWHDLLSTLHVRDRLAHPQTAGNMDVSATELSTALSGESWLLDNLVAVVQSGIRGYRRAESNRSSLEHTYTQLLLRN